MMPENRPIFDALKPLLLKYQPPFMSKRDEPDYYDLWSFKELSSEGSRKKEIFFSAPIIQKSYAGFYFMPVHADKKVKALLAPELLARLKGNAYFHIRQSAPELTVRIESVLRVGFDLYRQCSWV
jgi:hypothetical protein